MGARQDFSFRTSKRGTASKVTFTGPFFEKVAGLFEFGLDLSE